MQTVHNNQNQEDELNKIMNYHMYPSFYTSATTKLPTFTNMLMIRKLSY